MHRSPATGVFLNADRTTTPLALRANLEHNEVLHSTVVILTVDMRNVPHVPDEERLSVDDLGFGDDGICHLTARFGFQDDIDLPAALRLARAAGLEPSVELDEPSWFLSRMAIVPTRAPGMALWRKHLFLVLSRNAGSPADYFGLPVDRVVVMGSQVEL